jgi:hypothetical protein
MGVVVEGCVLKVKATWTWVRILQARCMSCRVSLTATYTAMPHLIFCPAVRVHWLPDFRVRYRLPR